ncbi:hypothetical protein [Mesorhizobium sp.]|nr:hypothetical protein [Mesorhizobium sp.]
MASANALGGVYDTPYIRSLPTRLEVTDAGSLGPVTKTFAPYFPQ